MILALMIIAGLLLWLGAGFATLTYACERKGYIMNGPIQAVAVILIWPPYLIITLLRSNER
jgi:hypothetical protein